MLAGLFLAAVAAFSTADHAGCKRVGTVIRAESGKALVCSGDTARPGSVHKVRRLATTPGAPGRLPFFTWVEAGQVRIDHVEGRAAEATMISGSVRAGDRLE